MKKDIGKHTDAGFVSGFSRFLAADTIVNSATWQEAELKLVGRSITIDSLFKEFQLTNCVLLIEHKVISLLWSLFEVGTVKDIESVRSFLVKKLMRYRNMTEADALDMLNNEIQGHDRRLFTPHVILYICGFGLGDLTGFLRDQISSFTQKDKVITLLTEFNDNRTVVVHNVTSSRENSSDVVKQGLIKGKECIRLIEEII